MFLWKKRGFFNKLSTFPQDYLFYSHIYPQISSLNIHNEK